VNGGGDLLQQEGPSEAILASLSLARLAERVRPAWDRCSVVAEEMEELALQRSKKNMRRGIKDEYGTEK
jgi:hypothetical protein